MKKTNILALISISIFVISFYNATSVKGYHVKGDYLTLNNSKATYDNFEGKMLIVDSTASWCGPCEKQIENLQKVYKIYNTTLNILTLSVSPISDSISVMQNLKYDTGSPWTFGIDYNTEFFSRMKVVILPTLYFFDEEGDLLAKWEGLTDEDIIINSIEEYIEKGEILNLFPISKLGFWEILIVNFILGILSSISPCLFPLFPSYVALSLKNEPSKKSGIASSFSLIIGIVSVLLAFTLIMNATIIQFLITNYLYFVMGQGVLLILAGMLLIKTPAIIYNIKIPNNIENWLFSDKEKNFMTMSYVLGVLYTVIAAPCALGYFLGVVSTTVNKQIVEQFFLISSYGIGAGLPFVIYAIFSPILSSNSISGFHKFSSRASSVVGVIILILGMWMLYNLPLYIL